MTRADILSWADLIDSMPESASLPHYLTPMHPNAVGSYGNDAIDWGFGQPMHLGRVAEARWWQRLVLHRALEHDADGHLCWRTVIISAPRQVGKSVLERVVCAWRLHQRERFGQAQDVLHIAHKMNAAMEVWRPAARWAQLTYGRGAVRWAAGEQRIELPDGSRWLIQASNDGAGVAFSLTTILVDEAWRVARSIVDAGLRPTLAEANDPQLYLVSTAGTSNSDLMSTYRAAALDSSAPDTMLIEWSAPTDADVADPVTWRAAAPHWDERRAERVREAFAFAGNDEWIFRQQWLNQWIPAISAPLIAGEAWQASRATEPMPEGAVSFGIDIATDRSSATIAACTDGVIEIVDSQPGANWIVPRVAELAARWRPVAVVVDAVGPGAGLADRLALTDVADVVTSINGREMAAACALFFDRLHAGALRFIPHHDLTLAVSGARKRNYGQAWIFARDNPGASGVPLIAATLALWGSDHSAPEIESSAIW